MSAASKQRRFTIRHKLFLASLSLFVIPWLGYRYVVDMNAYLLNNQSQALLDRARVVAAVLHERNELFETHASVDNSSLAKQHLYVRSLQTPILLDGYTDDWLPYKNRQQTLGQNAIIKHESHDNISIDLNFQLGTYNDYLYLLFRVHDAQLVYNQAGIPLQISDHMQIAITNTKGKIQRFLITTFAPGKINVRSLSKDGRINTIKQSASPIEAVWQEVKDGYNIEMRIPLSELGDRIGFTLADVDDNKKPSIKTLIGTLNKKQHPALGTIVVPSPEVEALLSRIETPSSRTWVIDQTRRVIARTGQLSNRPQKKHANQEESVVRTAFTRLILNLLLSQPSRYFQDELSSASRLEGKDVTTALSGKPTTHWRHTPDQKTTIVTAIHPVTNSKNEVIGAVAIEETSNTSVMVQNRAMEIVISLSIAAFAVSALILLSFSSRLTSRIRRLRNDADQAIAQDGRITGEITPTKSSDEIGDLSRSYADMLSRLSHYNRYLETMASKLSHELRTPITVLRSSIEHLDHAHNEQQNAIYLDRAKDGITRLDLILARMSEATRLEQTLQSETKHAIDIKDIVSGCVDGYRIAFPDKTFQYETNNQKAIIKGTADLIAQLLDKLVSNARDFSAPDTPITISVQTRSPFCYISVKNQGPQLPADMQSNLFNSMVSVRDKRGKEPHLGLGLYIVRLITEFHEGQVTAKNIHSPEGVEFTVQLPCHISS